MARRYIVSAENISLTAASDLIQINASVGGTFTANNTNGQATLTSMSAQTNIAVGTYIWGTGITTGYRVKSVDSGTQVTLTGNSTAGTTTGTYFYLTGRPFYVVRWWWRPTDNTLASAQVLSTRCRRLRANVTNGNGSTATFYPVDPGDPSCSLNGFTNSTSKATTSDAAQTLDESGAHVWNGYEQQLEESPIIGLLECFVFELLSSALTGTVHVSCGVEVEEIN